MNRCKGSYKPEKPPGKTAESDRSQLLVQGQAVGGARPNARVLSPLRYINHTVLKMIRLDSQRASPHSKRESEIFSDLHTLDA